MTPLENERLGVVEAKVDATSRDVAEIKSDVKALITGQALLSQAIAVRAAREERAAEARSSMGVWSRSIVPWVLTAVALLLTVINTFDIVISK